MRKPSCRVVIGLAIVLSLVLGGPLYVEASIAVKAWDAAPDARPAIRAVLWAGIWQDMFGWEDEMYNQMQVVEKLPQEDRLDFFRVVFLYANLDAHRGCIFDDALGDDAAVFAQSLVDFKAGPEYSDLSASLQRRIDDGIMMWKPIVHEETPPPSAPEETATP